MNYPLVLLLAGWGGVLGTVPALAHGTKIDYQRINGIEIHARYDSGNPMSAAQVNIYAPDNPSQPWQTGITDDGGRFVFTPDPAQPGNWEVMVRQAGHGNIVVIPVESSVMGDAAGTDNPVASGLPEGAEASGEARESGEVPVAALASSGTTPTAGVPLWVSMAAVVWGFIGTALFFARGKR